MGAYSSKFGIFVVYEPQQNGTYISSNVEEVTSWEKIANSKWGSGYHMVMHKTEATKMKQWRLVAVGFSLVVLLLVANFR